VTIRHESVPWVYSTSAGHVKILFHFIKPTPETDSRGILTHDLMVSGFDLGKSTRETRYCCIKLCEERFAGRRRTPPIEKLLHTHAVHPLRGFTRHAIHLVRISSVDVLRDALHNRLSDRISVFSKSIHAVRLRDVPKRVWAAMC
jgi:hypothetical protein